MKVLMLNGSAKEKGVALPDIERVYRTDYIR